MSTGASFGSRAGMQLKKALAALALALTVPAQSETQPAAIPVSAIGAKPTADFQGDALSIGATSDGACLRCGFQKLEGRATAEGLWVKSTEATAQGKLRLVGVAVRREVSERGRALLPGNMPAYTKSGPDASGPHCTTPSRCSSVRYESGNGALPTTGTVSVGDRVVRFVRPGLTEEYSVSADGLRQDFVVTERPAGAGELQVELALDGANAEATACGARLRLAGSGRELAYGRLRVEDSRGRELASRLAVSSASQLAVSVVDANASYPLRIDPTFSDADWVSLNSSELGDRGVVLAVAADGRGNVYIGGNFSSIGTVAATNIAKWDGCTWSALGLGAGSRGSGVWALALDGTDVYVGGPFTTAGGVTANYVAKWNGSAWSALGSGMNDWVEALAVNGTNLYAGGEFTTAGGVPANRVAEWNGSTWSALGSGVLGPSGVRALAVTGTNLYAGGGFTNAGALPANYVARWNGQSWSALGSGMNELVFALTVSGTNLYAGGWFTTAGGVAANHIAKWDGNAWAALGSGISGINTVRSLAVEGTDLYAGGGFSMAGGVPVNGIAKWDGNAWSALGSGVREYYPATAVGVWGLAADGARHVFAGGGFFLAGTNLSPCIAQANVGKVPTVFVRPQTQTAEAGGTARVTAYAAGWPPPVCLWYFSETNLLSSASSNLVLTNILFSQSGTYTVVVTNLYGAVTSTPAVLGVIAPVDHRSVPAVRLTAQVGSYLGLDYSDHLGPPPSWETIATMTLSSASQYWFDLAEPLPPRRFYRAWQTGNPEIVPSLSLPGLVPAITLTGNIGDALRVDYINRFGPIDAWVTLDTLTLTNTSQLYFDVSAPGQPERLYRLVPVP